jgi:hypothetical protein
MSDKEIIDKLIAEGTIWPEYNEISGDNDWIVEFPAGGELIGTEGFTWDDICRMYREQMGL